MIGEVPVACGALGDVGDLAADLVKAFAVDDDAACGSRNEPHARFDEGGFTGAVGAHDPHHASCGDAEVDVAQDGVASVAHGQLFDAHRIGCLHGVLLVSLVFQHTPAIVKLP